MAKENELDQALSSEFTPAEETQADASTVPAMEGKSMSKGKKIKTAARASSNGLKTFAFKVEPEFSDRFHKVAGPQGASRLCIALMAAAISGKVADFKRGLAAAAARQKSK